jgi:hypothetical protein
MGFLDCLIERRIRRGHAIEEHLVPSDGVKTLQGIVGFACNVLGVTDSG